MTYIANPIYDSVFKFMMEDERVAKILLSALLKKEVISVDMKQHEYSEVTKNRISMLRLDFNAKVRDNDGSENIVLIELQKTWLVTETLRFRQYLACQYNDKRNIPAREVNPKGHAYPIVSIYILGHKLGDLEEPVVYVKRNYLDYDSNPIVDGVPDPFVESLTHDSIIVQIPYLKGRLRNKLERILQVFDQDYCVKDNEHYLEVDESKFTDEEFLVVNRLIMASGKPEVKRAMEIEDEILSEIEARDTTIMLKDREIEEQNKVISEKEQVISEKEQVINEKEQVINEKEQVISEKELELNKKKLELEEKNRMIGEMVKMLHDQGVSVDLIAEKLNLTTDFVNLLVRPID